MSQSGRIVVMGKSKSKKATPEMMEILSNLEPEELSADFLDGVFVTMSDKKRFQIDLKHIAERGLDYDYIHSQVKAAGSQADIEVIEVIVDVDYITRVLEKEVSTLLDPFFS